MSLILCGHSLGGALAARAASEAAVLSALSESPGMYTKITMHNMLWTSLPTITRSTYLGTGFEKAASSSGAPRSRFWSGLLLVALTA